ncbi:endonuclease domain-containing protein [Candidatus Shapirobacteria bacterium]|nr:endonuclease domain-containing protein [Candidatus Shapirobacteria bacterium]
MKNIIFEAIHSERGTVRYLNELKDAARKNRNNPTVAEKKLWNEILKERKTGYLFLRQKPLYRFIADFYCSQLSLVIEVDGSSHDKKKPNDQMRDKYLECIGIKTLRFTNEEVLYEIDKVKEEIIKVIKSLPCQREI